MTIAKNLKILLVGTALFILGTVFAASMAPRTALAACGENEVEVSISLDGTSNCVPKGSGENVQDNAIYTWLIYIIRFLSAGVGIAVVGGIVYGAILFLTARDSAAQTQKAVTVIVNAIIGLLLFILMFAILNFLIPGGILT